MPRLNDIYTKRNDLRRYISGKMRSEDIRQQDMAEELGITQGAFSQKLSKGQFDYADLVRIFSRLRSTDEEIMRLF
jgi:predicted transcriptional regulator